MDYTTEIRLATLRAKQGRVLSQNNGLFLTLSIMNPQIERRVLLFYSGLFVGSLE